jgi:hypothetical protein
LSQLPPSTNDPYSDIPIFTLQTNIHNDIFDHSDPSSSHQTPLFPHSIVTSQINSPRTASEIPTSMKTLGPKDTLKSDPFDTSSSKNDAGTHFHSQSLAGKQAFGFLPSFHRATMSLNVNP